MQDREAIEYPASRILNPVSSNVQKTMRYLLPYVFDQYFNLE